MEGESGIRILAQSRNELEDSVELNYVAYSYCRRIRLLKSDVIVDKKMVNYSTKRYLGKMFTLFANKKMI